MRFDFESYPVDDHLVSCDAVCMGCSQPFQPDTHYVSRIVSIEPDRPDDLAATAGELLCETCFIEGRGTEDG